MVFIVPDQILEKTTCSVCDRYLSVLPIKVYANGEIKCGRCNEEDDGGALSVYNNVFEYGLFHCINRYDGCQEKMLPSKVETHEISCLGNQYKCGFCDFNGSSYFILRHIKADHREVQYLKRNEFDFELLDGSEKVFLYCENYVLFIIDVNFHYNNNLELLITCLKEGIPKGTYQCQVFDSQKSLDVIFKGSGIINSYSKATDYKLNVGAIKRRGINEVTVLFELDIPQCIETLKKNIVLFDTTFSYEIKGCRNILKQSTRLHSLVYFCGTVPVQLCVNIKSGEEKESFGLYLFVDPEDTLKKPWSCDVDSEIKLLSVTPGVQDYWFKMNHFFHVGTEKQPNPYGRGPPNYKSLYDILSPAYGFIKDDKITFEVRVIISSFQYEG